MARAPSWLQECARLLHVEGTVIAKGMHSRQRKVDGPLWQCMLEQTQCCTVKLPFAGSTYAYGMHIEPTGVDIDIVADAYMDVVMRGIMGDETDADAGSWLNQDVEKQRPHERFDYSSLLTSNTTMCLRQRRQKANKTVEQTFLRTLDEDEQTSPKPLPRRSRRTSRSYNRMEVWWSHGATTTVPATIFGSLMSSIAGFTWRIQPR